MEIIARELNFPLFNNNKIEAYELPFFVIGNT